MRVQGVQMEGCKGFWRKERTEVFCVGWLESAMPLLLENGLRGVGSLHGNGCGLSVLVKRVCWCSFLLVQG